MAHTLIPAPGARVRAFVGKGNVTVKTSLVG